MSVTVRPFLMFQGRQAEAAMQMYTSLVPGSEILEIERYGAAGPEGSVMRAIFSVAGQVVQCTDSWIQHAFTFTPSFSFFVECEWREQFDALWAALADGGAVMMPPDGYGFSQHFDWLSDRFGVSWQLNLA
jgi:predicted 3-demethylubiquinone-9 3-methyltransferase (glyoxalase superfamily)